MANKFRNEMEINLAGTKYLIRADFAALVEIESATGYGVVKLLERIANNDITFIDAKIIITAGLTAANQPVKEKEIELAICDAGLIKVAYHIVEFLTIALYGGEAIKKG